MSQLPITPLESYGILRKHESVNETDYAVEQITQLGFAVIDAGFSPKKITAIQQEFDALHDRYMSTYGKTKLQNCDEINTIRSPLLFGGKTFLNLAMNKRLHACLRRLIEGQYILNQQNGIVNPAGEKYNQGAWHRDLPYQHFTCSRPIAINALYCVDEFTLDNGATYVLPASHKSEAFPSKEFVKNNAIQVRAKAGSFLVLDCMLFHCGGYNSTALARRAVNHVFNIPFFKQMISLPPNLDEKTLSKNEKQILGFKNLEVGSVSAYLQTRGLA